MTKQIIAIDIDDVLSDSAEALRQVVNKRLGVNLTPEDYQIHGDYWNHYETVWNRHGLSDRIKLSDIEPMMIVNQSHVLPHRGAFQTLKDLSKRYDLVIVTSRPPSWEPATEQWLNEHFPGIFKTLLFTRKSVGSEHVSKGQICADNSVSWLIDDNVEHAQSAVDRGIDIVLFGDYGWHHKVPSHFHRCKNWNEVLEYFNAQS